MHLVSIEGAVQCTSVRTQECLMPPNVQESPGCISSNRPHACRAVSGVLHDLACTSTLKKTTVCDDLEMELQATNTASWLHKQAARAVQ